MANLIIKPNSATGDKLIIQDRAGAAVLTTENSGATLANGLALGTPASLTLTNSTFPAGMIRQVKQGSWGGSASGSASRSLPSTVSFATAKLSTSHVLIDYYFVYIPRSSHAQGTNHFGQAWLTGSNFGSGASGKLIQHWIGYYESTFHMRLGFSGHVLDTNPTSNPAYGCHMWAQGGNFEIDAGQNPIGCTLYEILV